MAKTFDYDRYRDRIAASEQRLATTRRFEEPDQVPVDLGLGGSFYAWMLGENIATYYQDRALALDVQIRGQHWAWENLNDDRTGFGLYLDIGPIAEGLVFGAPIDRPDGTSPWSRHILHTPADVEKLQIPDPRTNPGVQWILRELDRTREIAAAKGIDIPVRAGLGIHPPISAACALAGPETIYGWLYEEPALIDLLFDKLLAAFIALKEYEIEVMHAGRRPTSCGLADDHSAFISEATYRRVVFPRNHAIYQRYGKDSRSLHADGPNDHLFKLYANDMLLTEMDIGGFSDIANAKRDLPGKTVIWGGLNCKDVYGDFASAKPVVDRALSIGQPGGGFIFAIGGEAYAGVNPQTLAQVVDYAQRVTRK